MTLLASHIEHTLLKPNACDSDIITLCQEALHYQFHGVCVLPSRIALASRELQNSDLVVVTVVGFPLGGNTTYIKVAETRSYVELGAQEIDMVINIGDIKDGLWKNIRDEVRQVVAAAEGRPVKTIIETCYLKPEEIVAVSRACVDGGAAFIKTSTGFGPYGARVEDVRLIRQSIPDSVHIKASGGIKNRTSAQEMVAAGATRLGTSSGKEIILEA